MILSWDQKWCQKGRDYGSWKSNLCGTNFCWNAGCCLPRGLLSLFRSGGTPLHLFSVLSPSTFFRSCYISNSRNISNKMKAFVVFIKHTSFQLYHCIFSKEYLRSIHDTGEVEDVEITLSSTRLYDFCEPVDRGEWLEIFVALIEYLRSGQSKVGFLNNRIEGNMIHKVKYPLISINVHR